MPALLMHIQAARQIRAEGLPPPLEEAVGRAEWAYRLGAVLVDLPLFDRFWLKVALFLAHRPYPESLWGTAIHAHGSAKLAESLLAGGRGEHEDERLALVSGLLTHLAFDRAMHPPIEAAVNAWLRPDESHDQLHEALENYQCLVWHRSRLGIDGLGTAALREGVTVGPSRRPRLPAWLGAALAQALGEVYGVEPTAEELGRWASGMCGYRDLLSTPVARVSIRASERLAERRPWVRQVELAGAYERGLRLAAGYLEELSARRDGRGLAEAIGDGPLV